MVGIFFSVGGCPCNKRGDEKAIEMEGKREIKANREFVILAGESAEPKQASQCNHSQPL